MDDQFCFFRFYKNLRKLDYKTRIKTIFSAKISKPIYIWSIIVYIVEVQSKCVNRLFNKKPACRRSSARRLLICSVLIKGAYMSWQECSPNGLSFVCHSSSHKTYHRLWFDNIFTVSAERVLLLMLKILFYFNLPIVNINFMIDW